MRDDAVARRAARFGLGGVTEAEASFGKDDPREGDSLMQLTMVNLAKVCADQGEMDRADGLFRKALVLRERTFGEDHPQTKNIAASYAEFKKNRETPGVRH